MHMAPHNHRTPASPSCNRLQASAASWTSRIKDRLAKLNPPLYTQHSTEKLCPLDPGALVSLKASCSNFFSSLSPRDRRGAVSHANKRDFGANKKAINCSIPYGYLVTERPRLEPRSPCLLVHTVPSKSMTCAGQPCTKFGAGRCDAQHSP